MDLLERVFTPTTDNNSHLSPYPTITDSVVRTSGLSYLFYRIPDDQFVTLRVHSVDYSLWIKRVHLVMSILDYG